MTDRDDLAEYDAAICRYCGEGLIVRNLRTRAFWRGPFWRLTWTHADPQAGTDGTHCWAQYASPDPATVRRVEPPSVPLEVPGFGRSL